MATGAGETFVSDSRSYGGGVDADPERDDHELALLDLCLGSGRAVLAICRGMQLLALHSGGELVPVERENLHAGPADATERNPVEHSVSLEASSALALVTGTLELQKCSSHHRFGVSLCDSTNARATGWAQDGEVEAMEVIDALAVGVMWHPEDTSSSDVQQAAIFRLLQP